ncbi:MAG TPA: hypothetical protein VN811_03670 [Thermoanaerobaculia bacterium]|nr:hypothetical protein [Thermoanaerobaculia bacterium]
MSAESTLVFYGIRFEIPDEELESLETNTHPSIKKARNAGLQFYAGNFAEPGERYFLFVGAKLGILGAEHASEVVLGDDELAALVDRTNSRLKSAALKGTPRLYLQWMPDV